ncbi:heavy-metal-associated domain-containing protein [Pseudobdellovibrio exovorus]|uniref:HMA domain-containing protein n=1 Tax=Pseudobdellovibrio exovorus JSS TaxID=1184267 RepID=M4VD31_9BACT|nr:heavy metal-associated domain-containing protein [Pseudobdellovibrio exovorus]AGH95941.1 hypothetical protein A11Q_1725 [Pseudobdellovibrio exovorus JSS]
MKKIITIALLFSSVAFAQANAPIDSARIKTVGVNGMVCAFCAQGIEKKFKSQSEVEDIEVSLEKKFVKIKFKEGKSLSEDKITELLKDSGYEAVFKE